MKTQTKITRTRIGLNKRYLNFLYDLKDNLDNNNLSSLHSTIMYYQVDNTWCTFLIRNNIVNKLGGYYKWNNKIPVSIKIVNKFREYKCNLNIGNNQMRKQTKIIINNWLSVEQSKAKYNKSESTIRRIIKELKDNNSSQLKFKKLSNGVDKILINSDYLDKHFNSVKLVNDEKVNQEIGIIRKFLKWIY